MRILDPYKMLERFEKKYGEYNEILWRTSDAEVDYQNYIDRGYQPQNIPSEVSKERARARRIYREHEKLIAMCQGFTYGYNMAKKEIQENEVVHGRRPTEQAHPRRLG